MGFGRWAGAGMLAVLVGFGAACDDDEGDRNQCDPGAANPCPDGGVCEQLIDGTHGCFDPVRLRGMVFDLTDGSAIEGAHVSAADETGAAATDVVLTDAGGNYELTVPVQRNADGTLASGILTLRVAAQDYEPFPHGIRPALPIDAAADATSGDGQWLVENATTDVGLIPLPTDRRGLGSIAGTVHVSSPGATPGGALIVVEGGAAQAPIAWSDLSGDYRVFNVPAGSYTVHGYQAFAQLVPEPVTLAAGEHKTGVDLEESGTGTGTVTGSVNLVNPGDCRGTSVVLVPESVYDDVRKRGEIGTGLRAPTPGTPPTVTGAFAIEGVPDGRYAVLAAFENDFCVRDPDPGIAGTQVQHIELPDPTSGSRTIELEGSFKVTGALGIFFPGGQEPEAASEPLTFRWEDDSSEDAYHIVVYDAFGTEVWRDETLPGVSGGEASVAYGGPALTDGMYYQFRVTSLRRGGTQPISMTEDLLGVFYVGSPGP